MEFITAHWLDILTTILGLAYILLEYRASIWMWAVGFAMQAFGIVLYYQKGLYADCGMEFYYLSVTIYGWWKWGTARIISPDKNTTTAEDRKPDATKRQTPPPSEEHREVPIRHFPRRLVLPWLMTIAALWAVIFWILVTFTNSTVPLADAFTTTLSIVGIWALANKYLEQWFIWIVVDVITSVLYFYKDIPFKASLYALYVVIAIFGYLKWRRMMKEA